MESNGKSNVHPVIAASQKRIASRLFAGTEEEGKLEYVPVVDRNLISDLMATQDVPTASKMDSINGGRNPMQYLKWIVRQIYTYGLLLIGALFLAAVAVTIFASLSSR